jgi:hypothetical protein
MNHLSTLTSNTSVIVGYTVQQLSTLTSNTSEIVWWTSLLHLICNAARAQGTENDDIGN